LYEDEIIRGKLFSQSDFIPSLVNEILRLYSPAQFTFRVTTKPIYFNNQLIKEGSKIAISIGAANRDPSVFKNPTVFCDKRVESNISFGFGRHKCVGERLSIKFAKAFIERYKAYIEVFEMTGRPEYDNSFVLQMTKLQLSKIN
jgi:cytochrome P450